MMNELNTYSALNAVNAVYQEKYHELIKRGQQHCFRWGRGTMLEAKELIHETYIKLSGRADTVYAGSQHIFRLVSRMIRQTIYTDAVYWNAARRGGETEHVAYTEEEPIGLMLNDGYEDSLTIRLSLKQAMTNLKKHNALLFDVIDCRYLRGYTVEETSFELGISEPTVKRRCAKALKFLSNELEQ